MSSKDELIDLNKRLDRAKKKMFSLSGQRKAVLSRLRDLGVNNLQSARDEVESLEIKLEKLVSKRKSLKKMIDREMEKLT